MMQPVKVNLSDLSVLKKTKERYETLCITAGELEEFFRRPDVAVHDQVYLNEFHLRHTAEAYSLLNAAFKAARLKGHTPVSPKQTQLPKVAALTTLVIMELRPFRIADPTGPIRSVLAHTANQQFCVDFAVSVLKKDFNYLDSSKMKRWFTFLHSLRSLSLRPYLFQLESQGFANDQQVIDIAADLPNIEMLILFYELHLSRRP
jgi:hypothetical protein